ncbi:Eco57I restriction-modification methylase domain-containing protein [Anaerophaga thermohalophila]|jgi:hypothetical protein|uniref:Eco57I restriction-modification methylase domain-containing protein n=1 Tax=Anaerophaga thermohalophila TaxID=177400 RepID=UPI000237B951|nr:Eco57I restriction-modification methylase domain-containing protein [Anaerophaga thermohalophila]
MEKQQAQRYIKQVLNSRFDQEQFELFVRNLLNDFELKEFNHSGQLIPEAFRDHISHFKRLGVYTDPEGERMDILVVQTKSVNKLERTRTALRNFVVRHLKNREKFNALVAFYSKEDDGMEWRLSLVKIDIETERTDKGKIKAKEEIVPAKRFSFLVGENENAHTAQKQLLPLLVNDHSNPLIIKEKDGDGSVEGAFSIEKVTDEFYEQYKELYLKLTENAALTETLEKEGLDPVRFVKKLLGQIVFLYFLQKKGWLGVPKDQMMGEGPKNFLRKKFDEINENGGSYFNDFLRFLFYDALAKEHNDDNIKYFNKNLGCKIPFLNGGLFEADYENWDTLDLNIDNHLFSNPDEKTKAGDKGTGILDVFDRYNFTIREDEPLEKEVAVDPEMLGKVFENLLDVTDRKSKGAFYTPREIVHYMCQESLIHYLDNTVNHYIESYQSIDSDQASLFGGSSDKKGNLKIEVENKGDIRVPKEDIQQFIRHGHLVLEHETTVTGKGKETDSYKYKLPESIRKNAEALDKALADIKICDPAIGSGAFPVGLLHEIVTARQVLGTYLNQSSSNNQKNHSSDAYSLKRHAIQESIYGVDIDASAIDIARLRLWLSMIVDEEDYDTIDALPNLDYKIVCGNSLIGMPENAMRDLKVEEELEKLKEQFFHETDETKKKALRQNINQKIRQLLDSAESFAGYKIDFDFKLFFSEVWHQKNGFDVVIGNPPYLRIQGIRKENPAFADLLVKLYDSATGSFDLYVCFTEKGLSLTHPNGLLNFIMPVKWTNSAFGNGLRKVMKQNKAAKKIISFSAHQVFHASTYTGIQFFVKNSKQLLYTELNKDLPNKSDLENYINELKEGDFNSYATRELNDDTWTLTDKKVSSILLKLNKHKTKVKDVFSKFFTGLQTSKDSVYFIMKSRIENGYVIGHSKELDEEVEIERGLVKPLLKGDQVHRFEKLSTNNYVIFPYHIKDSKAILMEETEIKDRFPKGYEYLKINEGVLRGRENGKLNNDTFWFRYIYPKNLTLFNKPKLICPDISKGGNYAFDEKGEFYDTTTLYGYIKNSEIKYPYKYFLGLLNSSICWFFLKNTGTVLANGYFRFMPRYVEALPVPKPSLDIANIIAKISDYLINSKHNNELVYSFMYQLVDSLIFELYFPEELQSANKQILPHLGDLKPITDEMSDEEKLAIIQSEFERLYDPNHPVRNNLETLDSVEEVRVIKEALK